MRTVDERFAATAIAIVLAGSMCGCPSSRSTPPVEKRLDSRLIEAGFLRHAGEPAERRFRSQFADSPAAAIFGDYGRLHRTDAEDLAEGGVAEAIASMSGVLTACGVKVPEVSEHYGEEEYRLTAGPRDVVIWTREDAQLEQSGSKPGLLWGLATARTVALLNEWLAASSSQERVYALDGGNDLSLFLLTPTLFELVTEHSGLDPANRPYVPTEDYPDFGYRR